MNASERRPTGHVWQRLTARPVLFSCAVLGAYLLLCALGAGVLVTAEEGSIASLPRGAAATSAAAYKATSATPTTDPDAAWMDYVGATAPDLSLLDNDLNWLSTDCGSQESAACDADAQTLAKDAQTAQQHRNHYLVPPCLVKLDGQYHTLLDVLRNTASEMSSGIETNNTGLLRRATSDMNDAFTMMAKTAMVLGQATCA